MTYPYKAVAAHLPSRERPNLFGDDQRIPS
jgi:hypothetical protein